LDFVVFDSIQVEPLNNWFCIIDIFILILLVDCNKKQNKAMKQQNTRNPLRTEASK